jgi:hypothetical protein
MKKSIFLLLFAGILLGCSTSPNESIHLIVDGESDYSIVIPSDASPEELRAATFLQDHLARISGYKLPVVQFDEPDTNLYIFISKSDEITSGDGFSISTSDGNIHIKGGADRGCIYGVAELLEHYLGVRYYSPHYVVIPERENVSLPEINMEDSSPNTYRNINGYFVMNQDYKDFHRLHDIDDMFARGYYVHTFHRLIPWQEFFHTNPEYFAYMNDKRIIDQLCLSNPEVLELVKEKMRKEMELQPDKKVWSVSQDDNFSYCQCELCSPVIEEEESPAGPIIRFVNQVAEEFPDKIISTLAYQYSRKAPVKTIPADNVQIMLCTIELSRSKSIENEPTSASFLTDMEDWGKISNHIYLWDYTVNFNHYITPFPNLHVLQPNIQLFVKNNVKEHFQQSNTGVGHAFSELKSYLLAKLLWNPDANADEIIHEFTDGFYGEAAPWIRKYILHLEDEILETGEWLDIYGPPTNHQNTFLSEENLFMYNHYFDQAEKAVAGHPYHHLHVRTARMPLQYAMMEIGKSDMFGPRGWYDEMNDDFVLRTDMKQTLETFYETSVLAGVQHVNESRLTAEDYYYSTLRFIDVQVDGNLAFRNHVTAHPLPAEKYSNGELALLTNGVRGANDYKVHWLGWEAQNFSLTLDLENLVEASTIQISTLWDSKSWILHPLSVTCMVSDDGVQFIKVAKKVVEGDQQQADVNQTFSFETPDMQYRYVKFDVEGTLRLFDWHPSAGGGSWVFVDEIVVR